jgi:hypothetical protein
MGWIIGILGFESQWGLGIFLFTTASRTVLGPTQLHAFLTLAKYGGEWSASCPSRFTPRERAPGTHWLGYWVGPRAGLDVVMRKIHSLCWDSNPSSSHL